MTQLKAIRAKCKDCSGTAKEIKLCQVVKCALWPFRFGVTPRTARKCLGKEVLDRDWVMEQQG